MIFEKNFIPLFYVKINYLNLREGILKMLKLINIIILFFAFISILYANNEVTYIMDLPTCQTTGNNIILLDIGHRYFDVNRHTTNINISLGYGITGWLDAYAAYSFKNKDAMVSLKSTLMNDFTADSFFSLALIAGGGYKDTNGMNNAVSLSYIDKDARDAVTVLDAKYRPSFFSQIVIQKHLFSNKFSIGLVPTYAYNTNFYGIENTDDYSAGLGAFMEIYIFDRVALIGESVMNYFGFAFKYATYNAGIKYAGYRHTFTLWIGNSAGNNVTTPKISFAFTREFDL